MSFSGRPQEFHDQSVDNNGFFPALSLGEFQKLHRVPSNIAAETVEHQLTVAVGAVNLGLANEQTQWIDAGHANLVAVDSADNGARTSFYKAAVYYRAKAFLLADFQTFSRRDIAENIAKEHDDTKSLLLAESRRALKRLRGLTTTIGVELL
ncbi:MAG: head completion/stabilization protein [Cellvibrionaceae bacterium]